MSIEQTIDFFQQLYPVPAGTGVIELRRLHNEGEMVGRRFISNPSDLKYTLRDWENPDVPYGVFFGAALRQMQAIRGTKEDVSAITALWADIDTDKLGWDMNLTVGMLKTHELTPSAIVGSGRGLHLYWALDNPWLLSPAAHHTVNLIEQTMHDLAEVFGGDNTHDVTRVLRVPGSWNTKAGKPKRSQIIVADWREYKLIELADGAKSTDRLLDNGQWLDRKQMLAKVREEKKRMGVPLTGATDRRLTYKQIWELTRYGGASRGSAFIGLDEAIMRAVARMWLDMPGWSDDQVVDRVLEDVRRVHSAQCPGESWDWNKERREIATKLKRFKERWKASQ